MAKSLKVAVVDDDRDVRETLETALTSHGHEVYLVPNGLRLMSVLAVEQPDVILLDVAMSWVDGIDLCQALKQNRAYAEIPVIFLSARVSELDVQRGLDAGAIEYIKKPFDLTYLLRRVREVGSVPRRASSVTGGPPLAPTPAAGTPSIK